MDYIACRGSVVDRGDEVHVLETVTRRRWLLIGRHRHANLGAADTAPVHDLDLPQLAWRRRLGDRRRHATQDSKPGTPKEVPDRDRNGDVEDGVAEELHVVRLEPPPDVTCRGAGTDAGAEAGRARRRTVQTIDQRAEIFGSGRIADRGRAPIDVDQRRVELAERKG